MLFNSFEFLLIFFPLVTTAYFLLPHRYRWLLLLIASCYFYMAFIPAYILILFLTIGIDYVAGILIEGAEGQKRKLFLALSIVANIGVLGIFKYFNFFTTNLTAFYEVMGWSYPVPHLSLILPIGLSFHTFQSLSYTIEVYRGRQKAERHLGIFALYVMFYPQLVAGPIERPQNMLHQFRQPHAFDYQRVTNGLKLIAWGLFKKVVIADHLAIVVNQVYNQPTKYQGIGLIVATICFAYQIYCDFSGYSDIALGTAQVMGFKLMDNFKQPYLSRSVSEFWQRWHISLSTWFRDYLYIPLGGNRVSPWRWQFNLLVVFMVSGLWHGANWTFVIWGALHGLYLIISIWTENLRKRFANLSGLDKQPRLYQALQVATTFSLVSFAWIFFRANTVNDAFYIVGHLFSGVGNLLVNLTNASVVRDALAGTGLSEIVPAVLAIAVLELIHYFQQRGSVRQMLARQPGWIRWAIYYGLVLTILLFGKFGVEQFIYFQF
jgi:alginate O-acetyltransferase complex protein AlgI